MGNSHFSEKKNTDEPVLDGSSWINLRPKIKNGKLYTFDDKSTNQLRALPITLSKPKTKKTVKSLIKACLAQLYYIPSLKMGNYK